MEDVHDIYRDGKKENTLLWIDSTQKDSDGDGEYSVTLIEPVRNVVGVRVLEATIPATVMSVNVGNNKLALYTVSYPPGKSIRPESILRTFLQSSSKSTIVKVFDRNHIAEHETSHDEIQVFSASDALLLRDASRFDMAVMCVATGRVSSDFSGPVYYDEEAGTSTAICAHSSTMQYICDASIIHGVYSLPVGRYDGLRDVITELSQGYAVDAPGFKLDFIEPLTPKPERSMRIRINPMNVWYATGTETQTIVPAHGEAWCAVSVRESSCLRVLGFQSNPTISIGDDQFVTSSDDLRMDMAVIANSMVNLASERYVWLRCPEIEQHMCTGVGKVLSRGIGVFRLDLPGVFKEEATEYISMIPPEFHPISKLSKLTFRFDMGSKQDSTYSFNGIDHFILLSITSLKMDRAEIYKTLPRVLNPNYNLSERCQGVIRSPAPLTPNDELEIIRRHNSILSTGRLK